MGGKIQAKVRLNEDGTLIIYGSSKNYAGKYKANKDGNIEVSDVDQDSPVTIKSMKFATVDEVTTVTAELEIAAGPSVAPVTATGVVSGKLFGLESVTLLNVESKEAIFAETKLLLEMKDDCTIVLSVGGQAKVTGYWKLPLLFQM